MRRGAALVAAALLAAAPAAGQVQQAGAGYQPQDQDERGLWMQAEEAERELKRSGFVIADPALNAYVRGVFCRTVGQAECAGIRLYLLRTADFNAAMYPTGMMVVNSGLLLRMRNEAQLAAVLGHEYGHYTQRHQIRIWRDMRRKSTALAWLSVVPVASYGAAAALNAVQVGLITSVFRFSRAQETEADALSVPLMAAAGYDPREASRIWEQLREEQDATAAARHRRSRKDDDRGLFATHPPSAERVAALRALAGRQATAGAPADGRAAYRAAMAPWYPALVDDQIKLNDFGGTEFVLGAVAGGEWTPELLYARGELYRTRGRPEDLRAASGFYAQAITAGRAPAEAWRGLGLAELRAGRRDEGRAALREYLRRKPDAGDRAMMAAMVGEGA